MTWSEKLIAEWLELKGYYVRMSVPLGSKSAGGRGEADVIGLKVVEGKPNILCIEVGNLGNSVDKNIESIKAKFAPENRDYILDEMGLPRETDWENRYIAAWFSDNTLDGVKRAGYRINRLADVLEKEILPDLMDWKHKVGKTRKTKTGQLPTPPMKLDLICLLDYILMRKVEINLEHTDMLGHSGGPVLDR